MSRTTSYASGSRFSTSVIARARARLSPARTPAASDSRVQSRRFAMRRIVCGSAAGLLDDVRADRPDDERLRRRLRVMCEDVPACAVVRRKRLGRRQLHACRVAAADRLLARGAVRHPVRVAVGGKARARRDELVAADAAAGIALVALVALLAPLALRPGHSPLAPRADRALRPRRARVALLSFESLLTGGHRTRLEVGGVERAVLHLGACDGVRLDLARADRCFRQDEPACGVTERR